MKDQETLYPQYYNDVYKLQQQNAESAYVDALNKVEEVRDIEVIQMEMIGLVRWSLICTMRIII